MEVEKKSVNWLGIASLVFGIVGILTICGCGIGFFFGLIGVILGILGLTVLRNSGKGLAVAGLIVSGIALVFGCFWMFLYLPRHKDTPSILDYTSSSSSEDTSSSSSKEDTSSSSSSSNSSSTSEPAVVETPKEETKETTTGVSNDVKRVGMNEEFGNKTITGKVIEADLNYQNYNDMWTTIPEGKKCIYIKIKVTNISNESNYVSVSDFDCYVDDVAVSAELVNGMDGDDFNANIDPGRSAILGALYVVPENCNSIELEYDPLGEYAERVIIKIK